MTDTAQSKYRFFASACLMNSNGEVLAVRDGLNDSYALPSVEVERGQLPHRALAQRLEGRFGGTSAIEDALLDVEDIKGSGPTLRDFCFKGTISGEAIGPVMQDEPGWLSPAAGDTLLWLTPAAFAANTTVSKERLAACFPSLRAADPAP